MSECVGICFEKSLTRWLIPISPVPYSPGVLTTEVYGLLVAPEECMRNNANTLCSQMMDTGSEDSNYCHGKLKCTNCGAEMVPTYSSAVSEDDSTPAHARRQISRAGSTDRGGALANLVYVRPDPTGVDTDDTLGFDDPADSPSNRTCAYTNAQGRGCILPPLSSANYCSAHQCPIPLCRGGKDPHVPVCPDCATACARSISSARAQQAMPLPTVVSTVAADASATLPSPPITIPPPLEYYGTLGTEQYANPRQSAV
eukprot:m.740802 g.740802  ORF g.740802 m.740802 type:complete len:257 (+) comp23116_c3_seq23:1883-2653(+)